MNVTTMLNNTELVKEILEQFSKARNDDDLLYEYVVNKYGYSVNTSLREIHKLVREKKIPSQATVNRCRRKIQELYSELGATGEVAYLRHQSIRTYQEYNRMANEVA